MYSDDRWDTSSKTLSMQPHGFPTRRQTIRFIHSLRRSFNQSFMHSFTSFFTQTEYAFWQLNPLWVAVRPTVRLSVCSSHSRTLFINLNNVNFLLRLSLAANPGNPPVHLGNSRLNWNRFPFSSDKQITMFNLCDSPWSFSYLFMIHFAVVSSCRIKSAHFIVILAYRF